MGIEEDVLAVHNDQYLSKDFDIVLCSIGNAFYRTDKQTNRFEWRPNEMEEQFLHSMEPSKSESLKDFAFRKMYLAKSCDIAVGKSTGVICTRKACNNRNDCGFIPDYPIIRLDKLSNPINSWVSIEHALDFFKNIIKSKTSK
jgi:hypothetical protein